MTTTNRQTSPECLSGCGPGVWRRTEESGDRAFSGKMGGGRGGGYEMSERWTPTDAALRRRRRRFMLGRRRCCSEIIEVNVVCADDVLEKIVCGLFSAKILVLERKINRLGIYVN